MYMYIYTCLYIYIFQICSFFHRDYSISLLLYICKWSIMKTMCPLGNHRNGFVAIYALGRTIYGYIQINYCIIMYIIYKLDIYYVYNIYNKS